jgi:3-oxoacyl-[acyl-carrier-protein] synthase II
MIRDSQRVVITGVGVVSPLGEAPAPLWEQLLAGQTAARPWPDLASEGHRNNVACRIDNLDCADVNRGQVLAVRAALQAVENARVDPPKNAGVFLGSTLGESAAFEHVAEGQALPLGELSVASFVEKTRAHFKLSGPRVAVATACAAGNYAIGAGLEALRHGRVPLVLAGGVEPFSRLAQVGFSRSRAMAAGVCKPFDRDRTGMLLGEGAAVFVLETIEGALRRGARPLAEVVTLGLSCDAYHATAPQPDGRGMAKAMRAALDSAGIGAEQIGWINAHGSGTRLSDAAEAKALRSVFGNYLPPVSGSKGALGHALGAASAIETAVCVAGLLAQTIPPTAGHDNPDANDGIPSTRAP